MVSAVRRRPRVVAVLLLLLASAIWGSTFVVVKQAISQTSVLDFLAWRFILAGLLLAAARPRALARLGRRGWLHGVLLGVVLALGYMAQTFGLRSTPAAVSGFLIGLQVVFTPVIGWTLLKHRPQGRTWAAVLVATTGLALMTLRGASFGIGEGLTIVSSAVFALQIVGLEQWASSENAYGLATVQLLTIGGLSVVAGAPGGIGLPPTRSIWAAVVLTAVAATAFAFVVQSWAQSHLSATSAAVVFATEPVFAGLFAWMSGEHLSLALLAGGALVVLAMLVMGAGSKRPSLPVSYAPVEPEGMAATTRAVDGEEVTEVTRPLELAGSTTREV
jgi:drug/metabolite transporter (DMT)-like permease